MNRIFQEYELLAFLGDYADDYNQQAIIEETTEVKNGTRYWLDLTPEEFNAICAKHDTTQN